MSQPTSGKRGRERQPLRVWSAVACVALACGAAIGAQNPTSAQQGGVQTPSARCRISGRLTSGTAPLPGASIVVSLDNSPRAITSSDVDGTYVVQLSPGATYRLAADLAGFSTIERTIDLTAPACDQTIDLQLVLQPRRPAGQTPPTGPNAESTARRPPAQPGQRFQALNVQGDAAAATTLETAVTPGSEDVARLLPPGFSLEAAQSDAIAIAGNNNATNLDRGLLNDRLEAVTRGQFDPATGQFAPGFGPLDGEFGRGGGPRGGGPGRGGPGGGRGDFLLGGRAGRAQSPYQGSINYTFGGSALNSSPYQLRPDVPVTQPQFAQNNFGATFGGPLKIPGVYANTNGRTTFQVNYSGNQSGNLFDQYATVPTEAMRGGDFSASTTQLIDPATGQPFPGNRIPADRVDPSAAALLPYIPAPNLPGTTRNFHVSTTARSSSNQVNVRITQNLSSGATAGGRGGGGRGGPGGPGGFGGRGGRFGAGRGTNVSINGQLQWRRNTTEALNVFPDLGGETTNTSISAPITLNVQRGRSIQNINVNIAHTSTTTINAFAGTQNVAGEAGILYPSAASTDPANWGVPTLTFTGFTGVRGAAASERSDTRLTTGYTLIRPAARHQLRMGGDFRLDSSSHQINSNARGTFAFTGVYTSGGAATGARSGADLADFLLGLPQQATLQVGGTSRLRQPALNAYIEDNWQKNAKLTLNLGLRYELAVPYVEADGRMANLDVTPTFTQAVPVTPGGTGPFTGSFPSGLLNDDANNLGPRLGLAYRVDPRTVLRGGYSITYNSGSYASIARELSGQPPFTDTETINNTFTAPLTMAEALLSSTATTTNNWGVDRDFALGTIQTWNATVTRNVGRDWTLQAGYTATKGTDLDILRAPNLAPGGSPIAGAQPYIWESSGGRSMMNGGTFQVQRRLATGYRGGVSYTFAKSMDSASSLGAGGTVVAQNDKDLESEWGISSFDRRHQISGNAYLELPWGPNRRWLKDGGTLAGLFGEWSVQLNVTLQSGTPLTARVLGASTDLLRGVNGSLRADYDGAPIQVSNPTIDEFFNIAAFSAPGQGMFGSSQRNMIVGPGARQLDAMFQRDVRLGGSRAMTLQVNAVNLLNTVQWSGVDTNVNSPSFGQVTSVRPMRTVTLSLRFRY
jgi:hypothetical protein